MAIEKNKELINGIVLVCCHTHIQIKQASLDNCWTNSYMGIFLYIKEKPLKKGVKNDR